MENKSRIMYICEGERGKTEYTQRDRVPWYTSCLKYKGPIIYYTGRNSFFLLFFKKKQQPTFFSPSYNRIVVATLYRDSGKVIWKKSLSSTFSTFFSRIYFFFLFQFSIHFQARYTYILLCLGISYFRIPPPLYLFTISLRAEQLGYFARRKSNTRYYSGL